MVLSVSLQSGLATRAMDFRSSKVSPLGVSQAHSMDSFFREGLPLVESFYSTHAVDHPSRWSAVSAMV